MTTTTDRFQIELFLFEDGTKKMRGLYALADAIKVAQSKIIEGYDKVTIYDKNNAVNRVYWNVNGKPCRL